MAPPTYQTIKLSKGKHSSPDDGACVMELASMLGGEAFTDHPRSACPVIGAFLRAYNDAVDDTRRQDLYAYAAKVVGSRANNEVELLRRRRLAAWRLEVRRRRLNRIPLPAPLRELTSAIDARLSLMSDVDRAIAQQRKATHREVLSVIDELLALGSGARSRDQSDHRSSTGATRSAITEPSTAPATTSPG